MRAINPIYIGLLLVVVLLVSIFSLNSAKSELIESKNKFTEKLEIANELDGLKKSYSKDSSSQKNLKRILSQKALKSANLNVKFKKGSVSLESKEMDRKSLNFLMTKILNGTYNVTNMKIKKLNDSKASFEMEIQW